MVRVLCGLTLILAAPAIMDIRAAAQSAEPVDATPVPPAAVIAFARDDALRQPDSLVYFHLDDGAGILLERLRRDASTARRSRLEANLFELIGRPKDQPAAPGDIFLSPLRQGDGSIRSAILVESSTGYVAYFPQLGKGSFLGEVRTTLGRPFAAMAKEDRNFALLTRRAGKGRSAEVILYHPTSGRALALSRILDFPSQPEMTPVRGLPTLGGPVTAVVIDGPGGRTRGYLLLDEESGEIHYASVDQDGRVTGDQLRTDGLYAVFPTRPEQPASPRFLAAPITDQDGAVRHLLVVDAGTGQIAWLAHVDGAGGTPRLRALTQDLSRFLDTRQPDAVRSLALVGRRSGNGATLGAWLIDARTRRVLLIDRFDSPDELRISPVNIER
jgi:hypothetical protein